MYAFKLAVVCLIAVLAVACGPGQTVTLIYRGPADIEVQSQLLKDGKSIGFVEKAGSDKQGQRLVLRIREAALIHEFDVFLPYVQEDKKNGIQIQHYGGQPLRPGAIIYYPPLNVQRPVLKAMSAAANKRAESEKPVSDENENTNTGDENSPPEPEVVVAFKDDTFARRSVRITLGAVKDIEGVTPEIRAHLELLQKEARRPGNELEILRNISRDLPALTQQLTVSASEAFSRGDKLAAKRAIDAAQKTAVLRQRLQAQIQIKQQGPRYWPTLPKEP